MKRFILAACLSTGIAAGANAQGIDADLMFVIDNSGSMGAEFTNLGAGITTFVNGILADTRVNSVNVGLIRYSNTASLDINLTSDLTVFSGITRGSGSGIENALGAVDFAVTNTDINYRANSVKSIILITDEDADDRIGGSSLDYSNSFGDGATALAALLDDRGFLNNVIHNFGAGDAEYNTIARPLGATFDIDAFRATPEAFLTAFAAVKLQEIIDVGTPVIPLPAGAPLLLTAVGALGFLRRKRKAAAA